MSKPDLFHIYTQSYADLALWYSTAQERSTLFDHFETTSIREGRIRAPIHDVPPDWSDELYSRHAVPQVARLWRLGVLQTMFYQAQIEHPETYPSFGRASASKTLAEITSLSLESLEQAAEFERTTLARGIISSALTGWVNWTGLPEPAIERLGSRLHEFAATTYDVAILVPCLETGGAELVAFWHYRAAKELGLKPVLINTDRRTVTTFYRSQQIEILNLPEFMIEECGVSYENLSIEQQCACLAAVLSRVSPSITHLIHSYVGYNLASLKLFRDVVTVMGSLLVSTFCPHIHANGVTDGYFRYIPNLDQVAAMYVCDNVWYGKEISGLYGIADERITSIRYPVTPPKATVLDNVASAKVILWASRMDFQKNPNLALEIARQLPAYEFHFFGRKVMGDDSVDWLTAPSNAIYCGEFYGFAGIDITPYAVFLYTARFDGMPNIILEAAAAGLPIVSSAVGGISEFLDERTGVLVDDPLDVSGYVKGLEALMTDHVRRRDISCALLAQVLVTRSFESFVRSVGEVPAYAKIIKGYN